MGIAYKAFISGDPAAVADELWWDWFAKDSQLVPMTADLQTAARELEAQLPTGLQVFAKENPSASANLTHARLMFNEEQGGDVVACLEVQYPSGRVALYKAPDFNTPSQKWHIDVTAKPIGGPDDEYEDEYEEDEDENEDEFPEGSARSVVNTMVDEVSRYEGPGPGESPERDMGQTMVDAAKLLADLGASYEYPGWINVDREGINYAFGDVNGPFGYDFGEIGDERNRDGGEETIPNTASAEELAAFVRRVVTAGKGAVDNVNKKMGREMFRSAPAAQ